MAMYMSGKPAGGVHVALAALGAQLGALARRLEDRVGSGVAGTGCVAADGLDAGGDEAVALARLDRVERHADGLQARRAVAVDGDAGDVVEPGEHSDDTGDVEATFAGRLADAHHQVVDIGALHLRHLLHQRLDDLRRHVVGAHA